MWRGPIRVRLKVRAPFRVGSGRKGPWVDLPVSGEERGSGFVLLSASAASSFKGLLRKSALTLLPTVFDEHEKLVRSLFGSWVDEKPHPGKIAVRPLELSPMVKIERPAVAISEVFGSAEEDKLFTYEVLYGAENDQEGDITLSFEIEPLLPLTDEECAALLVALRGMAYSTFGGFGSRGCGLIEGVSIAEEFVSHAETALTKLASPQNREVRP